MSGFALIFWARNFKKLSFLVVIFTLFTLILLCLTGAHYFNDFIFGIISVVSKFEIFYKARYFLNLKLLEIYVYFLSKIYKEDNNKQNEEILLNN